ncbi:unnamed protein product [Meganyctiphanes norvegica]|uniref:F-box domain-containing protein n=1 Tax=Meganyctiphanes norvegica TaxID=48144 RepID=A0AAV2Q234_MEGNR
MACIDDLPEEILEFILCLVSPYNDLRSCMQVCQRWYDCCHSVVEKRKSRFYSSLKAGCIEWFSVPYPSNIIPISKRYSHCASVHESSMFVFGGCTSTKTTFNDLWRFDLGTHEWTRLLTTGTYPSPKAHASMVTWKNHLVLFGGWTHPSLYPLHQQWVLFNELHVYDIVGNRWTQLYYPGAPPLTAGHSATMHGNIMVMFGGLQKHEGTSASTNNIYCLDLQSQCWFKPVVSEPMPNPRYSHSQIKIDDKHILILAGCGGSNKLYTDVWLLTLPNNFKNGNEVWRWEQITVDEIEQQPSQMQHNPACKVGNSVVMLAATRLDSNISGGNMSQLLVPEAVRRQPANIWVPPPVEAQQPHQQQPNDHNADRLQQDHNINGQRGFLRNRNVELLESSSDEDEIAGNNAGMKARHRARPSIRPNASNNRDMRHQMLARMQERLKELSRKEANNGVAKNPVANPTNNTIQKISRTTIVPFLLDISKVVKEKKAKWLSNSQGNNGGNVIGNPPMPSLRYSLVVGRGHLIMFGGTSQDPAGVQSPEVVYNTTTFISAPSSSHYAV